MLWIVRKGYLLFEAYESTDDGGENAFAANFQPLDVNEYAQIINSNGVYK